MKILEASTLLLVSLACAACGDTPAATKAAPAAGQPGSAAHATSPAATAPTTAPTTAASAANPAVNSAAMPGMPQTQEFTEDELQRYLASVKDIRAFGAKLQGQDARDAGELETMFQGMSNVAQFNEVLGKHGFDQASFLSLHHNVVWTYAALMIDEQQPEMDKAKAEQEEAFEKMKGMLSPEQLAAMKQQLDMANTQVESMRNVPPANKTLLAKHLKDFETAIGKS